MIRRRNPIETKIHHERWLVSYSDFITLLFAFFVVMYSVSQVNENKYRVLADTLQSAFSATPKSTSGATQVKVDSLASLQQVETEITNLLQGLISNGSLSVWGNEDWVEIELNANVLFTIGSAEPSEEAQIIFAQLADTLAPYENAVAVSGHTDNIPIQNQTFANNWELSSARAVTVVNLLAYGGVDPTRLSAIGYGEYQPVAGNDTPEGRASNRRVVLRVARSRAEAPREGADQLMASSGEQTRSREPTATTEQTGVTDDTQQSAQQEQLQSEGDQAAPIKPIKLPNGGLLFTSDPKGRGEKEVGE